MITRSSDLCPCHFEIMSGIQSVCHEHPSLVVDVTCDSDAKTRAWYSIVRSFASVHRAVVFRAVFLHSS